MGNRQRLTLADSSYTTRTDAFLEVTRVDLTGFRRQHGKANGLDFSTQGAGKSTGETRQV